MKKNLKKIFLILCVFLILISVLWIADIGKIKTNVYVSQIVKMRTSPKRLVNVKTPKDYGMNFKSVDIITADQVRLSAWEIPAKSSSDKLVIINHPLSATRYGAVEGLDDTPVEFLPMVKHLHENGYNVLMYDHRGQGESDGGTGKTLQGKEAPVGAGQTEWQDVVASLNYVKNHSKYQKNKIALLSQCMGANATFLAWKKESDLFNNSNIKCMVAVQPTISYKMMDRLIQLKTKMDLVERIEVEQKEKFGFGFANALANIGYVNVPILFAQVKKDQYTYDAKTGKNDIEYIYDAFKNEKKIIWIGPEQANSFGTGKRFDGYNYFNQYPQELIAFLSSYF